MKPQLAFILDNWNSAQSSSIKSAWRENCRVYLANQDLAILEPEIMAITSLRDVNKLLGAGAVGSVFDMVNAKRIMLLGSLPIRPSSFASLTQ